jgi:hypothetical protein
MEEEILSHVKAIIIMLVILGIAFVIVIFANTNIESLKGQAETVGASGFIVTSLPPTISCSDLTINFGPVNITDPQSRDLNIIPLIAFSGVQSFGFAKPSSGMGRANVGDKDRGLIILTKGKGGANLQFDKPNFAAPGLWLPTTPNLSLRVGFWIWTGDTDCVNQSIMPPTGKGIDTTSMSDILTYTSINCPVTYIGTIYKTIVNTCYTTPNAPPATSQPNECEQNGGTCMTGIKCEDAYYEYWTLSGDCDSGKICCDLSHIKTYKQ